MNSKEKSFKASEALDWDDFEPIDEYIERIGNLSTHIKRAHDLIAYGIPPSQWEDPKMQDSLYFLDDLRQRVAAYEIDE